MCATWGPFTKAGGDRPQERAREAARAAGVASPLVVALDRSSFYAFADECARAVFLEAHAWGGKDREVIERVDGGRPFRPFLDVDAPAGALAPDVVAAIRAAAEGVAKAWGVPAELAGFDVAANRRAGKSSAHLVAAGWEVPDGPAAHRFAEEVAAAAGEAGRFVDSGAAKCSRGASLGLRLPFCRKLADARRPGEYIPASWLQPGPGAPGSVADWCLQGGGADGWPVYGPPGEPPAGSRAQVNTVIGNTPPEILHLCASPGEAKHAAAGPPDEATETASAQSGGAANPSPSPEEVEAFAARVAQEFPHFVREEQPGGAALLSFRRTSAALCSCCGSEHDRAGAYVRAASGSLWLNCRRAEAGAPALLVHCYAKCPPEEMPAPDAWDTIAEPDERAAARYNADAFAHHAPAFLAGCDLFVKSPWKTGKTVWVRQQVEALRAKDPAARVLLVSMRCALSTDLAASFGAVDYRSIKGEFDDAAIARAPVSVFQVESLKRIPSDVKPFDLVVVDEPAALFGHVYQPGATARRLWG